MLFSKNQWKYFVIVDEKSSLNRDSNPGPLVYSANAQTTELLRPNLLTDSDPHDTFTRLMLNKIRITLKTKLFKFFIHSQVWNILYFIHCKTGYRNILFSGHDYSCTETDIVFIWSCFVKQGPGSEAIKLTWSTHLISISLLQK